MHSAARSLTTLLLLLECRRNHIPRAVIATAELEAEVNAAGELSRHVEGQGDVRAANALAPGFRSLDAAF
jgi:hypothetical protein